MVARKRMRRASLKKYHYDDEFEGERLVDNLTILENLKTSKKKVLAYSPKLRANILVYKNRLERMK